MTSILVVLEKRLWTMFGGLILLSVFMTPGTARAGAIYFAEALGVLQITDINHAGGGIGVFIEGYGFPDPIFDELGTGIAGGIAMVDVVAGDPFDLDVGDRIDQTAESSGITSSPFGSAYSDIFTDGYVFIDNATSDAVTISFSFFYSLTADTRIINPVSEFAFAAASIAVFAGSLNVLFAEVVSESDLDGGLFTLSDTLFFDVVVPGFLDDEVNAFVDTLGYAETLTEIPQPNTIALFGLGLAGLGISRRKRTTNH